VFTFGEGGHFVDVVDVFAGDGFADDGGVGVEAGDDADAVLVEAFVAEEGAAEVADADEEGVGGVGPAEKFFDGVDDFVHGEA